MIKKIFKEITNSITKSAKQKMADIIVDNTISLISNVVIDKFTKTITISGHSLEYYNFNSWFMKHKGDNFSKEMPITNRNDFFMYEKTVFIVTSVSDDTTRQKQILIKMIGKNEKILKNLYDEIKTKKSKDSSIYTLDGGYWTYVCDSPKRELKTVIIDQDIKNDIQTRIENWQASKEWYQERGLSYKLGFILYGPPGTGKTSFIKALASHYGYDLYILDLAQLSDTTLMRSIRSTGTKSIIVMEDFDSVDAVKARNKELGKTEENESNQVDGGVTLSGLLNALDGIVPLDDRIIIMTTNLIEGIDEAVMRKGRIDGKYFFGPLTDKEIKEYIKERFDNPIIPDIIFSPINGCDIQDLYFQYKNDLDGFILSLMGETND